MISTHEKEIANLQKEWVSKLDASISQIQSETDAQIRKVRAAEADAHAALDKKLNEINRDYILISKHLELVQQKENSLNSLMEWEVNNLKLTHGSDKDLLSNKVNSLEHMLKSLTKEKDDLISSHHTSLAILKNENSEHKSAIEEFTRVNNNLSQKYSDQK